MKSAIDKMHTARAALLQNHFFYGMLATRLELIEDSSVETACVNGKAIKFNGAYVQTLTQAQCVTLVAHETMHPALGHIWRMGSRDGDTWNESGDFVINQILDDEGFEPLPNWLLDPQYKGMSADEIYTRRMQDKPPQDQEGDQPTKGDFGGCGKMEMPTDGDGNELSEAEAEAMADDWNMATAQAENTARAAGQDPKGATNATKASRKAVVDWRVILRRFIASAAPTNFAWHPQNRRFIAQDLYLPSMVPDKLGEVIVIRDTSASTQFAQPQFMAELNDIISEVQPAVTRVIDCDVSVGDVAEYGPDELIPETYCGGGGTSFKAPFDRIESEGWQPVCAIYLTDLDPNDGYPVEPGYPVLWVSCDPNPDKVAPWGDTVWMAPSK